MEKFTKRRVAPIIKQKLLDKLKEENPSLRTIELALQVFGILPKGIKKETKNESIDLMGHKVE